MVLALINDIESSGNLLKSAVYIATNLKKEFGILSFVNNPEQAENQKIRIHNFLSDNTLQNVRFHIKQENIDRLADACESLEASFLIIQPADNRKKTLRNDLVYCRDLRIPYLFYKQEFPVLDLGKVMLPIGFLVEELEKAQFASAFGRFCQSRIEMMLANDYGSKAATNAEKMKFIFDKFELQYSLEKAKNDSFKVEKEAVRRAEREGFGIVIISASRDYGLDDIIFGPKEYHLIRTSAVPLLIVNPRGDLYTLCD